MATLNLRRFSKPEMLRKIDRSHLITFFEPYTEYLSGRGIELPSAAAENGLDYTVMSNVLLNPNTSTPPEMSEALYYINEMSTPEGFDLIQEAIADTEIDVSISEDAAYGDLALQVWVQDRNIIERLHAEQFLFRPRSFEYFKCTRETIPDFEEPSEETVAALEADLDEWFAKKRRGRASKVFSYVKDDFVWFLVRHGEPFTRESIIKDGESKSLFYRPEKYDVIVYNPENGEIRMNARSKGEKELYRTKFGLHFFGDSEFFDGKSKFTLEPLRESGSASILCEDIEGIDWVRLKEFQIFRGGTHKEIEIRKAEDIFASLEERDRSIPNGGRLSKASFQIKFADSKTPRTVTLSSGNRAQFKRDDDAEVLEKWLIRRGFVISGSEDNGE
jgi:hypothetical protein